MGPENLQMAFRMSHVFPSGPGTSRAPPSNSLSTSNFILPPPPHAVPLWNRQKSPEAEQGLPSSQTGKRTLTGKSHRRLGAVPTWRAPSRLSSPRLAPPMMPWGTPEVTPLSGRLKPCCFPVAKAPAAGSSCVVRAPTN